MGWVGKEEPEVCTHDMPFYLDETSPDVAIGDRWECSGCLSNFVVSGFSTAAQGRKVIKWRAAAVA